MFKPDGVTSLEGLLFPDTYQVSNAESEGQVIDRMIGLMERVGNQEDIVTKSAALGRTPYEILIIASMIEKEAKVPEDRAKISRVIHNRLFVTANNPDEPVPLCRSTPRCSTAATSSGSIPTRRSPRCARFRATGTRICCPGLPATPIANPGRASIKAALNPAPNPPPGDPICRDLPKPDECFYFFYVLADEDGAHAFAATGEQHQANVAAAAAAGLLCDDRPPGCGHRLTGGAQPVAGDPPGGVRLRPESTGRTSRSTSPTVTPALRSMRCARSASPGCR